MINNEKKFMMNLGKREDFEMPGEEMVEHEGWFLFYMEDSSPKLESHRFLGHIEDTVLPIPLFGKSRYELLGKFVDTVNSQKFQKEQALIPIRSNKKVQELLTFTNNQTFPWRGIYTGVTFRTVQEAQEFVANFMGDDDAEN